MIRLCALGLLISAILPLPSTGADTLKVWVSIAPQVEVAARIGGPHVEVEALLPPGLSPATYEPTPRQVAELSAADLLIRMGVPFEEPFLAKVRASLPRLRVVDGREGIILTPIGSHGHDHHQGEQLDPHFWLDPLLLKIHAATVARSLSQLAPQHAADFEGALGRLEADLDALHEELSAVLAPVKGCTIFVFHPAFGYLARRYGLAQSAIEIEGKEPTARQLATLIDQARLQDVRVLFVQPQFRGRAAQAAAEAIGAHLVELDPLAPSYFESMRVIAGRIAAACGH